LFCGAIHRILQALISQLNTGYMDDLTIGGPEAHVSSMELLVWGHFYRVKRRFS